MQRRRITGQRKREREEPTNLPQRNVVRRLLETEVSGKRAYSCFMRESFSHFSLKQEFDTLSHPPPSVQRLGLLDSRSRILEIVAAKNLAFIMTKSGACIVYDTGTTTLRFEFTLMRLQLRKNALATLIRGQMRSFAACFSTK